MLGKEPALGDRGGAEEVVGLVGDGERREERRLDGGGDRREREEDDRG